MSALTQYSIYIQCKLAKFPIVLIYVQVIKLVKDLGHSDLCPFILDLVLLEGFPQAIAVVLHPDPNQCVLSSCCYCKGSFSRQCYGGLVNQLAKRNTTEFVNWLPFVPLLLRFRSLRQGWDEPLDNWTSIFGDSSLPLSFI